MIIHSLCLSVFALMLVPFVFALSKCMENEREALLQFKLGLIDEYGRLSSWGRDEDKRDCCKWRYIECSNLTGHVVTLDLRNPSQLAGTSEFDQPLRGKLSPSLIELKHLTYLDLSYNHFGESRIPKFIGSFSRLQYLSLESSDFFGIIPNEIGNLTDLHALYLGSMYTMLSVDNLDWLSNLHLLETLFLWSIDLGDIEWLQSIEKLPFLSELYIGSSNLGLVVSPSLSTNTTSVPLRSLGLENNNLISSSIFNWIFNLSHPLVYIDLSNNPLGGFIPSAFGNMTSLESFRLSGCFLEGEIPNSFSNLDRLRKLDLEMNSISGNFSDLFQILIASKNSLEALYLWENKLSGSLPDITRLSSLKELQISENKLQGSFPKFAQTSVLESLDLSSNELNGPFPDLTLFPLLSYLDLSNNKLKGRVPESIGHLSNLKKMYLSDNILSLEFNSDWSPLFQLDVIDLSNCKIGPHFPEWFQSQNNFSELHVSNASLADSIPYWLWDLSPRLSFLNISHNHIHGTLPDLSLKFIDFRILDMSANRFTGPIPLLPPNISLLNLSKNDFSGSMILLCTLLKLNFLQILDLSYNRLSGELPDCWTNANYLEILDLSNNNFSGNIPPSLGFLGFLEIMSMRNNHFTGVLPSSLQQCTSLQVIDFSRNHLSGKLPAWIGTQLTSLVIIIFRMNNLSGTIPHTFCNLNNTQVLDLSQNILSGTIPRCFNRLYSLIKRTYPGSTVSFPFLIDASNYGEAYEENYMAGAWLEWKGEESEYKSILGLLKCIDLSSNQLVGKIPQELACLGGLISLNLSRNNLRGDIMKNVSQMKMLEVLDLSKNKLSGQLPNGLAELNFLSVLNLSDNNFSGKIPKGTQLQGFDATSYGGNPKLCGLPLEKKCSGEDGSASSHPNTYNGKDQYDEDKLVKTGFYVSVVLGFAVGFWGFVGPLFLQTRWRQTYFEFLGKLQDLVVASAAKVMGKLRRKFNV